jgi:U4/U6 small nuclear ribonucleoprotein PRP31
MNTLADEFLADLGEDIGEQNDANEENEGNREEEPEDGMEIENLEYRDLNKIVKLVRSEKLNNFLNVIEKNMEFSGKALSETDPEYQLIVEASATTLEISHELTRLHNFIRDIFAKRFPELESLVLNSVEYAKVVQRIGNEIVSSSQTNELLKFILGFNKSEP